MNQADGEYEPGRGHDPERSLVPHRGTDFAPAPVVADGGMLPGGVAPVDAGPAPMSTSLKTYAGILLRHKWLILVVFVGLSAASIPLVWTSVVPVYRATAVIRVSPVVPRVLYKFEENGILPLYSSYLNTQVSVIRSPNVLQRVLDVKAVQETEWYQQKAASLLHGPIPDLERLTRSVSVSPRRNTELIDVSMAAEKASDAKLIVDAVVEQYLDVVRRQDRETEKGRVDALQQEAESLQRETQSLITRKNVVSTSIGTETPDEFRLHLTMQLNKYEEDLEALVRERKLNEARLARLRAEMAPAEETLSEADASEEIDLPVRYADDLEWRRLQQSLFAYEHALELLTDQYGEQHPKIKQAVADVAFAGELLRKREAQLDDPGAEPVRSDSGVTVTPDQHSDPHWLENQIALSREEEALLRDDIRRQEEKVRLVSERAQELASINREMSEVQDHLGQVRERLKVLELEGKAPARVTVAATSMLPSEPYRDQRPLLSAMALFGAFGCGIMLALARTFLDPSVRQAGDVMSVVEIPFLGYLPKVRRESEVWEQTPDALHESMRMIRTALLDRLPRHAGSSVLITSSGAQAGKTSVAILLAKSLSHIGKKVLLVDADLRQPTLTRRLGIEAPYGLTDVLSGAAAQEDVLVHGRFPGVDVMPCRAPSNGKEPELMANGKFSACLKNWKRAYDFILFDSSPILPVADARILAGQVEGAILTLRASHCRKSDVADAVALLASSGCRPLGTVLVGVDKALGYSGSYAYAGSGAYG